MRNVVLVLSILAGVSMACNLGSAPQPTAIAVKPTSTIIIAQTTAPTIAATSQSVNSTAQPVATVNNCTVRTDWPLYTVLPGDTLSDLGVRTSSTTDILVIANCLNNPNALSAGQQLRVPMIPAPRATPTSDQCPGNISWFFTFNAGGIDRLCPLPVQNRAAIGEDFEGGRMLWYGMLPSDTTQWGASIYVIYNDTTWEWFHDAWDENQPSNDPAIVPPANRYQPVRGFGKVWRENISVRQKLGWAYEPEAPFAGRDQYITEPFPKPITFIPHFYMDHGKAGIVLRMYTANDGLNKWEVAGTYPH